MALSKYERARKLCLAFNTGLSLLGVVLGVSSLVFILNESRPELTPRELLWGGLGTAFLLVLTGILGMMCTMTVTEPAQQRSAWKCYLVLAGIVGGLMGGALRWASISTRSENLTTHMSKLWNKVPDETALAIQSMGQCCGFGNYTDRIQEPCIRFVEQVGCGKVMVKYHRRAMLKLVPVIWTVLSATLLAILSGMGLWIWGERKWMYRTGAGSGRNSPKQAGPHKQPNFPFLETLPGTPKGQSYDEWHKTVFQ